LGCSAIFKTSFHQDFAVFVEKFKLNRIILIGLSQHLKEASLT